MCFLRESLRVNRRKFIKLSSKMLAGSLVGGGYGVVEAKWLGVSRFDIQIPNLPRAFHGRTIALVADLHHSIVVPDIYIAHAVSVTNALAPDIIVLGGDYVTCEPKYHWLHGERHVEPCFAILKNLSAPLGVFGVTGNHDTFAGAGKTRAAMAAAGIHGIDNSGVDLDIGGNKLRLCGVEDLRTQRPSINRALGNARKNDAVILVSHNPDLAEEGIPEERVGLLLSGHTHGGQVVLPFFGAPAVSLCSKYGQKYRSGLVQGPACQVLVTRGVGTLPLAVRILCPPEIALITMKCPAGSGPQPG